MRLLIHTLIALVISVTTAAPALSSSPWRWLYPQPNNLRLNAVAFLDANTAVAVGEFGVVLRTTDAGVSWSIVREPNVNTPALNAIFVIDAYEAVLAGDDGITMRTYDGGMNWNPMGYNPGVDFVNVHFTDGWRGMAAGSGDVYLSEDGGVMWIPLDVLDGPVDMHDVHMTSADEAVAVGQWGAIMQTLDGGATWQQRVPTPYSSSNFNALSFTSDMDGVAGAEGLLYATSDGGATWSIIWENNEVNVARTFTDVCASGSGEIVSVGRSFNNSYWNPPAVVSAGFGLWTGDGSAWDGWEQPVPLRAIDMNSGIGLAVGDAGAIVRYAGDEWEQIGGATALQQTRGCADFDGNNGILASAVDRAFDDDSGGWTNFFLTSDGARSWREVLYSDGKVMDVAFANHNTAFAVGRTVNGTGNVVLKSSDAGNSWASVWNSPGDRLNALDFFTATRGVAVGVDGKAYVIDNDVVTAIETSAPYQLFDVTTPAPTVAYAVGDHGTIVHTDDGGQTWTTQSSPTAEHLRAVHFVTARSGVAVGLVGTVLRTDDGGVTWVVQDSQTDRDLFGVFMADPAVVHAVGAEGTALRTTSAGASWVVEQTPTPLTLGDVIEVDPTRVVAVGANQTVIERSMGTVPVAFGSFSGTADGMSVSLRWQVAADEPFLGIEVYRAQGDDMSERIAVLSSSDRSYTDSGVAPKALYTYRLVAIKQDGGEVWSAPWSVTTSAANAMLAQNFPNPFNPSTRIRFEVPQEQHVELTVHDSAGRRIATLVDASMPAGGHDVEWRGRDAGGTRVASGVYFYRLRAGNVTETRKMVVLK